MSTPSTSGDMKKVPFGHADGEAADGHRAPYSAADALADGTTISAAGAPGEGDGNHLPFPGDDLVEKDADSETESEKKKKEKPAVVSPIAIFRYADRADVAMLVIGSIAAVVSGGGMPAFSFVFGRIMEDLVDPTNAQSATAETALIMVYVGIAMVVVNGTYVVCWTVAAGRQVARIRLRFFEAVLRQDIGWHDEHSPGELTARATGDTRVIKNGINDKLALGISNLARGVLGFAFGFVFSWELTLVLMGMMPILIVMAAIFGGMMAKMTEESRKNFAAAGSIATEVMENIRTVQTFSQEAHEVERFNRAVLVAQRQGVKKEFASNLTAGTIMGLVYVTYMVGYFFSAYLLDWGRASMGDIISTFLSVLMACFGMGFVAPSAAAFVEARAAAYTIFQAIDRVPPIDIDAGGEPVDGFRDSVEFRNVKFAYPTRPDMELFKDLNLTIRHGQKVAFSGASGSGKSSIIGLIQRFYDPLDGQILCDGRDMRELCLKEWRDQIGIVSQEPNLFAGTMVENVRIGKEDATMEEVIAACKQANIHDTIMALPDQYDTEVGSVGSQLSGGQKQRIAIARALVKRPAILLLDEATSALDRRSEMEVQTALDELMRTTRMTVIIIAHRLATIVDVDRIYYVAHDGVEGSRITESGTFKELMALNGAFAAMAMTQGVQAGGASGGGGKNDPSGAAAGAAAAGVAAVTGGLKDLVPNAVMDDGMLAKLDAEAPRTERQMVPIEELAQWEVKRTKVGLMRVFRMNREKTWALLLAFVGSMITGAAAPSSTILYGNVMNIFATYSVDGDAEKLHHDINRFAPLYVIFAVACFTGWLLHGFYGYAGEHLTTKIRTLLFQQILRQDMSFFDIPGRDAGTLAGMLSGDCEAVHQLFGPTIGLQLQTLCTISAGLIIGFIFCWRVAFVALACMPVIIAGQVLQSLISVGFTNKQQEDETDDSIVTEALSNVRTVTSFNLKENRIAAYKRVIAEEGPREVKRGVLIGTLYGCSQFVFYGAFGLCFWYGGTLISKGQADFRGVTVAGMSVMMGSMGAGEAGGFATKFADARRSARRVFSVIDRVPDVDVCDAGDKDLGDGCDVAFRQVQFIYPARPKQVVLQSVDLSFRDGTSNGLMGMTGCGKSTIIQMLARFYDRRSGRITVNGRDLNTIDIATWRENISIVLQQPDLFSGTVRENIRYAKPDATDEEVIEAATLAHIHHEIIKWPEGYETDVGYKGRSLSGGQKQRVAIARGLLRRPRLLLLDEATSALDNATEAKVQENIDAYQATHRITTVSIAHRLTTIRHCDQIIVLDTGRIIESGSHDELMALDGEYKTRYDLYTNATTH